MTQQAPYGYCPTCGAAGVQRERRPNGNDKCQQGHEYPSASALPNPNSTPDVTVYYKLEGYSGWSSPDIEAARTEVERFHKTGRIRPRILKATETVVE